MAFVLISGLGLSSCGGDDGKVYERSEACSVSRSLVEDLAGTNKFTVDENDASLPLDGDRPAGDPQGGNYVCRVDVDGDKVFAVTIEIEPEDAIAARKASIATSPDRFEVAGGEGAVEAMTDRSKKLRALWVCGEVGVVLEGETHKRIDTESTVAAMKAWAKQAGCWKSSS